MICRITLTIRQFWVASLCPGIAPANRILIVCWLDTLIKSKQFVKRRAGNRIHDFLRNHQRCGFRCPNYVVKCHKILDCENPSNWFRTFSIENLHIWVLYSALDLRLSLSSHCHLSQLQPLEEPTWMAVMCHRNLWRLRRTDISSQRKGDLLLTKVSCVPWSFELQMEKVSESLIDLCLYYAILAFLDTHKFFSKQASSPTPTPAGRRIFGLAPMIITCQVMPIVWYVFWISIKV